ncbi:SDR family oxidoreductase, partial [Acinetobacter baumannii]
TLGSKAIAIRNETGTVAAARELTRQLQEAGLRLDAVFINAGMAKFAAVADVEEAMWDAAFNANVKGAFFQIQALLPILNPGTSIVL